MKPKIVIPLVTLLLIFFPMLIMSIRMNAFWIDSQYEAPFVLIPAFLIGDSLLLPPLNYFIYVALMQVIHMLKKRTVFMSIFYCLLLSILLNSYTHYLWSHDAYPGIVDPQYGVLSTAGWWHYVMSIVEFTIVFTFVVIWVMTVRQQSREVFQAFERAIYILMVFNVVNMSGIFVNKDLFLLKHLTPDLTPTSLLNSFSPLIMAILLLFSMRKMHRTAQMGI